MKNNFILLLLILLIFSCNDDNTKTYYVSIRNNSDFIVYDISIEMDSLPTDLSDSLHVDSLMINNETEKMKFNFDRNSSNGCRGTGITMLASFEGTYTQNDSLKWYYVNMDESGSDFITVIIDNELYIVLEN